MTERLWERVADDVLNALKDNGGYELIITGHSLGAGVALLLNILLHQDKRLEGIFMRAFAYASPPVYSPVSNIPEAIATAINYMHDLDDVPFLSVDAICHEIAALTVIDDAALSRTQKAEILLDATQPSITLLENVDDALHGPLPVKEGIPMLVAPVAAVAWACAKTKGKYDLKLCDPTKLAKQGMHVIDAETGLDHFPTRYELAFNNVHLA